MRRTPPLSLAPARSRTHLVDRLATRLARVGLGGVLADTDRLGRRCEVPGAAAGTGFTWDETDQQDPRWWPQGVASLADGAVLLVSWYAKRNRLLRTPGTRITVVDRSDPDRPRYRHVLLVMPRRWPGIPRLGAVLVHAGGIAVVGDLLYVADTRRGLRMFRLADVLRLDRGVRAPRNSGHDYVLPQLGALRVPRLAGARRLQFSFISVGEVDGRPTLVVGEYRRAKDRAPRLVRYALDPRTQLPAVDRSGRATPIEIHLDQPRRMQGVAVHERNWFVTASAGPETPGDLYAGRPGAWHRYRAVLPAGPEDLAWGRTADEVWSVSEWPGRRWVFPIAVGRWSGQAGSSSAA